MDGAFLDGTIGSMIVHQAPRFNQMLGAATERAVYGNVGAALRTRFRSYKCGRARVA